MKWCFLITISAYIPLITFLVITTCASTGICIATQLRGIITLYSLTSEPVLDSELRRQSIEIKTPNTFSILQEKIIAHNNSVNVTKFLVITTQKSGSTWFVRRLATHPEISTLDYEPLQRYNRESLLNSGNLYDWSVAEDAMIRAYRKLYNKSISKATTKSNEAISKHKEGHILGFKVMYNQVRWLLPELIDWCYDNNITVVHFIRGASVASYWSYNAQFLDRLQTGSDDVIRSEVKKQSKNTEQSEILETNQNKIDVFNPDGAASFVNNLEDVKTLVRRRFMYSVKEILYHEVIYEKIIGKFSQIYWETLFLLLGANEKKETFSTLEKVHPDSCHSKIPQWEKFRERIKNTDSYFACEMDV